jgi:riboflavin synthase
MFSGLVEEMGIVKSCVMIGMCKQIEFTAASVLEDIQIGDSISVNGVCLTVISFTDTTFTIQAVPETLRLTNIIDLIPNNPVNLERSLRMGDRIGGHMVQGHVDGTTTLLHLMPEGDALNATFAKPDFWQDCFIHKGFITLDGMSLTITNVTQTTFSISFIPHTQALTITQYYQSGTKINVEVDHTTKTMMTFLKQQTEMTHG